MQPLIGEDISSMSGPMGKSCGAAQWRSENSPLPHSMGKKVSSHWEDQGTPFHSPLRVALNKIFEVHWERPICTMRSSLCSASCPLHCSRDGMALVVECTEEERGLCDERPDGAFRYDKRPSRPLWAVAGPSRGGTRIALVASSTPGWVGFFRKRRASAASFPASIQ